MEERLVNIFIKFCEEHNCILGGNIHKEQLKQAMLSLPNNSTIGLNKLLGVNSSYLTHEFNRKLPENIKKELITVGAQNWILRILLYLDRCPICSNIKKSLDNATCSYSCSNKLFRSGSDNANYLGNNYVTICFNYHKKECVVCKESNIVEVHHFDEDHTNNHPSNLIPLCSTHHRYWHSRYRNLIENTVISYRNNYIKSNHFE
jgi:hypothetical protein